jgi:drug/metabolite transporter (DMT)-like permease
MSSAARAEPAAPPAMRPVAAGGLRYMALSAFWFSIMALCVKLGGRRLPSQELVLVRAVLTLAMSGIALRRAGLGVRSDDRARQRDLLLRGLCGTLGLTCFYWSVVHLPLAEATLLQYTNPLWAALLAAVLLGERLGRREGLCLAASLAGVLLVVRPAALFGAPAATAAAHALPPTAVALALLGALGSAAAYVVIRRMGTAEDPRRVTLYLPLVTVPVTLPFALGGWVWPTAREWAVLLVMSGATQLAQVCMTRGLQREPAARATAVGYLQLVFAAAWGWMVFGERPTGWTALGAGTIVVSTLALAFRRRPRVAATDSSPDATNVPLPAADAALAPALAGEAETAEAP